MKKFISFIWKWSWIVTVPVVCLYLFWIFETATLYTNFKIKYDSTPIPYTLHDTGKYNFKYLIRQMKSFIRNAFWGETAGSKNFNKMNLLIAKKDLSSLTSNLPHSGRRYIDSILMNNNKSYKIKARFRGDFVYHWAYQKKSWRLKTKKNNLYNGIRTINLIAPKQFNNYLSSKLANYFEVIYPYAEMVNLYVNNKDHGTHALIEQLSEITLRRHRRMPGDIYTGESIGRDRYHPAINLFDIPGVWRKTAVNNHYPDEHNKPIDFLITLLHSSETPSDRHQKLSEYFNMEAWGKFSAMESLMQTYHYDNHHNWRIYYDPVKSQFEPVIWDPVGWFFQWVPGPDEKARLDIVQSELHVMLFQNADFLRSRQNAISDFFHSGKDTEFLREVDEYIPVMQSAVADDPMLSPMQVKMFDLEYLRSAIQRVFTDIKNGFLNDDRNIYYNIDNHSAILKISGRRVVRQIVFIYTEPVTTGFSTSLSYLRDNKIIVKDISGTVSINNNRVAIDIPLIANYVQYKNFDEKWALMKTAVQPARYMFTLKGVDNKNKLQEVLVDRGDGTEPAAYDKNIEMTNIHDMYAIANDIPADNSIIWNGDIIVDDFIVIKKNLIIRPGTMIKLKEGACLIIRGQLHADGMAKNPVKFIKANKQQKPWGTIALTGQRANGSYLKHCEFKGGSGYKDDLQEYSGMFSVHDVTDIKVENCSFHDNNDTDDMVHVVYSKIFFSDCTFKKARSDGLDLDISDAVIENCRFIHNGNDGIDLMETDAVVVNTLLRNNADKGISVGENSRLIGINTRFTDNGIGLQVKDGSSASILNSDILNNRIAVDAYKKNWQYGTGGRIYLYKSLLSGNIDQIKADKKSIIKIYDSYIDQEFKKNTRIILKEVDSYKRSKARFNEKWFFPDDMADMRKFEDYQGKADMARRGAVNSTVLN